MRDVFDRPAQYDPNTDATVRVEAGRLRNRLRDYYMGLESEAGVTIDLPKGGYAVTFSFRSNAADGDADGDADVDERSSEDRSGQLPEEYLGSLSSMAPMDRANPDSGTQHDTPETL